MFRMNSEVGKILAGVFLLIGVGVPSAMAGNPGEAGLLSLRMGVGAREAAMGGAGVTVSEGASGIFWNPANNVFADFQTELMFQHYSYLGLFNQESLAVAQRAGGGYLGFLFTGFYSDSIDRRGEDGVGNVEGTFKPYDVVFGVSYARGLGDAFAFGINAKMVYERIDIYSDTGFAFDFFVTHKAMIEGLMFAASATNIGGQVKLKDEPFDLPSAFRLGIGWTPTGSFFAEKVTFAGDLVFPNDSSEKAHIGGEYRIVREFMLRLGTRINYDNQGLTAGAGFVAGRLGVDYAYEASTIEGFDDGHKFSLKLTW